MRPSYFIFFGAVFMFLALIAGFIAWYIAKKKKIHAAQEHWARAIARLGGRELPQSGPGGTRTFEVGGAALSVVNYVFLEENIAKLVTPMAAPNSWHSQLTGPCTRPTPPFVLTPFGGRAAGPGGATGDPEFDARWTISPLLDARHADVMALLTPEVRHALNALPANTYQIASGGQHISAFRADVISSEGEVEALTTACALLAGQAVHSPAMGQQPGMAPPISAVSASSGGQQWSWRYSPLAGVMYGPIPVGIIVVAVCGVVYLSVR